MYEGIYQTEEEKKASLYSIGSRIRYFRKMAKLTQAELASLVDIDYRTLSRYENGNSEMGVNLLFKIAAALHVSADDLAPEWMGRRNALTDEKANELIALFSGMDMGQKKEKLRFAYFTLSKSIDL